MSTDGSHSTVQSGITLGKYIVQLVQYSIVQLVQYSIVQLVQ